MSSPIENATTTTENPALKRRYTHLFACVVLVLATAAVFSPVVNQGFSGWDDIRLVEAVWKPGWERAWALVTDIRLSHKAEFYYNPLSFLSLMADQGIGAHGERPNPVASKVFNLFFHLVNCLLVYYLLVIVTKNPAASFLGSLMFAMHPLQTATVAWIAERKNLLATMFYVSGLIVFIQTLRNTQYWRLIIIVLLFLCSLLSKPSAVVFPIVLAAAAITIDRRLLAKPPIWGCIVVCLVISVAWGLYVMSTEIVLPGMLPSPMYRPLIASGAIWFYLSKLVFPFDLAPIYPKWKIWPNLYLFIALLVASTSLLAATVYFSRRINRWALFGGFFFLLNLSLVTGLFPFGYINHSYVADHFIYLPMVGISIIIAVGTRAFLTRYGENSRYGRIFLAGMALWVTFLGALTFRQTHLWSNPSTVWQTALEKNPTSVAAFNNLGVLKLDKGDLDTAESMFLKAAELAPFLDSPQLNLGNVYLQRKDYKRAETAFKRAVKLETTASSAYVMLGRILRQQGKNQETFKLFEDVLQRNPNFAQVHNELGLSYYNDGKEEEAVKEFRKAIELAPFLPDPYYQYGAILLSRGHVDEAIALLEKSLKFSTRTETLNVLGAAYAHKGRFDAALLAFQRAFTLQPDFPGLRDNIANALMDNNRYTEAEQFCAGAAIQGKPCKEDTVSRFKR